MMDGLPKFHYVARLLDDGTPLPQKNGKGSFVPRDWKERREWEVRKKLWAFKFDFKHKPKILDQPMLNPEQPGSEDKLSSKLKFVPTGLADQTPAFPPISTCGRNEARRQFLSG
ncbi:hypothetical protein [Paenibacillus sp. GM1FR]|uniref:hypothetical protein n=1 Tax=Paenibacillus sp. GM1FR TaxID=2059267 RepID=UPI000C274052|nr:hypothetical protein [Paenibacillus sp. GM1FR]